MPRAVLLKEFSALSSFSIVLITFWARFAVLDQRLCMHRQAWVPAQASPTAGLQASGPARVTLLGCHSEYLISEMISSCGDLVPPLTCLNKHSTKLSSSWLSWGAGPVSGLGPFALVRPACAAPGASSTPYRPHGAPLQLGSARARNFLKTRASAVTCHFRCCCFARGPRQARATTNRRKQRCAWTARCVPQAQKVRADGTPLAHSWTVSRTCEVLELFGTQEPSQSRQAVRERSNTNAVLLSSLSFYADAAGSG